MSYQLYVDQIAAYERDFKKWETRVERIIKRYRDDKREDTRVEGAAFNVLWSNVQTLKAATYSRTPLPDVSRRFHDNDPVGRVAALMLERALEYQVRHFPDFGASLQHSIYDRFLGGRGTSWIRYEPKIESAGESGEEITDDAEAGTQLAEVLVSEDCPVDYVHWRDFGHGTARTWEEVSLVWRKVYLTKSAAKDRFPDDTLPLDATPEDKTKSRVGFGEDGSVNKRALVYEMWDKEKGCAVWLSKSLGKILDEVDDPLGLEEFFPTPRPLFATLTTDSLIPIPDFTIYQDQAAELDTLSARIDGLVKALQIRGVYNAAQPELARLFSEAANTDLIPVKNWQAFAEKKGLSGAIDIVELLPIAQALNEAYKAFEQIKGQIYELTGISDILRGETAASETATAQKIKNSYASLRLKVYQDEVEVFASNLLRLKAEIICNHFDPQTICELSGCEQFTPEDQQFVPQAVALLKNGNLRRFRIEVQTDSMIYQDEQQEKNDRMEMLKACGSFFEQLTQMGQETPLLVPVGVELLKFGVTGFRVGRAIEGTIDAAAEALKKKSAQDAQKPPPPNPDQVKAQSAQQIAQAQLQADQQKTQMQMQAEQQANAAKLQQAEALAHAKAQADLMSEAQRQQHEQQMSQIQSQNQLAMEQFKQQAEKDRDAAKQDFDRWKADLENTTKVVVAEIAAKAAVSSSAIGAVAGAEGEEGEDGEPAEKPAPDTSVADALTAALDSFKEALVQMRAPRTIIRDADGRAQGIA